MLGDVFLLSEEWMAWFIWPSVLAGYASVPFLSSCGITLIAVWRAWFGYIGQDIWARHLFHHVPSLSLQCEGCDSGPSSLAGYAGGCHLFHCVVSPSLAGYVVWRVWFDYMGPFISRICGWVPSLSLRGSLSLQHEGCDPVTWAPVHRRDMRGVLSFIMWHYSFHHERRDMITWPILLAGYVGVSSLSSCGIAIAAWRVWFGYMDPNSLAGYISMPFLSSRGSTLVAGVFTLLMCPFLNLTHVGFLCTILDLWCVLHVL